MTVATFNRLIGGFKVEKKYITIEEKHYNNLLRDSDLLSCLEACGVDNWQGYDEAMEMFNEEEEE